MLGASTLTYGIAKSKEFKENQDLQTIKGRFNDLKENWLTAMYLEVEDKKSNKDEQSGFISPTKKIEKPPINQESNSPKESTKGNPLEGLEGTPDFTNF